MTTFDLVGEDALLERMRKMTVRKASAGEQDTVAALAAELWPTHTAEELSREFEATLCSGRDAVFLALSDEGPVGFAHCSLREDYVEGTEGGKVGYLEGIFVKETQRRRGIGTALVFACQSWAKKEGCWEFASDCELQNGLSRAFHLSVGFSEANRIICFVKTL